MTDDKTKNISARKPAKEAKPAGGDTAKVKSAAKSDEAKSTSHKRAKPKDNAANQGPAKAEKPLVKDGSQPNGEHPQPESREYITEEQERRPARRLGRVLSIGLPLMLLVLAILYVGRAPIAAAILMNRLSAVGIAESEFIVEEFGFTHMQIASVVLGSGGEFEAERIRLFYRWPDLVRGVVHHLDIERPHLRLEVTEHGISAGGVNTNFRRTRTDHVGFPSIRLRHGVIDTVTALGTIATRFDGTLQPEADKVLAALALTLDGSLGKITGTFKGTFTESGSGTGQFSVKNGQLHLPGATLDSISGDATFNLAKGRLQSGTLNLFVPDSSLRQVGFKTASLTARANDGLATAEFRLLDARALLDATLRAKLATSGAPPKLTLTGNFMAAANSPFWQLLDLPAPEAGDVRLDVVATWPNAADTGTPNASFTLDLHKIAYSDLVTGLDATLGIDLTIRPDSIELTLPAEALINVKRVAPALYQRAGIAPPPTGPIQEPLSLVIERSDRGPSRMILVTGRDGLSAELSGALSIMSTGEKTGRPPVAAIWPFAGRIQRRADELVFSPLAGSATDVKRIGVRGRPAHAAAALFLSLSARAADAR